jgi:serine/threonine protein phosphatase 1
MLRFSPQRSTEPQGARGYLAYVVGDVHGRLDLLEDILAKIHAELQRRPARKTLLVFVGDLVDRGPSSAQVIERLRTYRREGVQPVFLLGNHEEVFLRILKGDTSLVGSWLQFGGLQCLESYGVDRTRVDGRELDSIVQLLRGAVPQNHVEFLDHAGVRPGVELEEQSQLDLRWIREPFLSDETHHGAVVVHGHTITKIVEQRPNRIGIDTGAYRTGVLTALAIEGGERWLLDTRAN